MIRKHSEGVQGRCDPLFLHEPACVQKTPASIRWKLTLTKRKFLERNTGAHHIDLLFVAAKFDNRALQRCRTNINSRNEIEHLLCRLAVSRFIHVDHYVRAVKRNDSRIWPGSDQRQKMDRNVTKKDMQ